jgi:hypothetical protein
METLCPSVQGSGEAARDELTVGGILRAFLPLLSHSPQIRGSQFTKAPFVVDEGSFQFTVCKFGVPGSTNHQSPLTSHT